MYKVLIVDDEVLVRVGLKTTIDWEANGFTVVAEASNGEQGYEQYKKHMPDVVITDIKMPKKDGLWLVEEVRKDNQHTKILVLTCYDEFSFARKALKVGADDYILKSEVEDEELVAVMQSLKKKLDNYNKSKHVQDKELMSRNDVKRSVFTDMVKSDFHIDSNLSERCGSIEFPFENCIFAFTCISIGDSSQGMNTEPNPLKQTNNAVLNILLDLFAERSVEYIYTQQNNRYVFFLSSQVLCGTEFERMFSSVVNTVKQYFDCSINIVFTNAFTDIKLASAIYKDFTKKAQILFYKKETVFFSSNIDSISFKEPNVFYLKKEHNKRFIEAIGQEDTVKTDELVREVGRYFEQNNVNPMIVKIFYSNLMGDIFSSYGLFLENDKGFNNHEYYHYQIENSESLQAIMQLLVDFTGKVINQIRHMRHTNSKVLINRAINYIQYHYDEKISLEDVAEQLHLSKHYLCSSFKKATGENMSLYINKLRIEKAKRMLLESDGRIKEIFEEVGYSNQQYFSKVFKKITGMTIMEYKESSMSKQ
jgi:two-component system, response regulator YesN